MPHQVIRSTAARRRCCAAALTAVLSAGAGATVAEAAFDAGTYEQGDARHSETLKKYGNVKFTASSFDVRRVALPLRCKSEDRTYREQFSFVKGGGAKLSGTVASSGAFAGEFRQLGAALDVSGRIRGRTAKMKVRMVVDLGAGSTGPQTVCRTKHTFRLRRTGS